MLSEQNVAVARKPPEAIPGGLAAPGLMAQVITSKGADHLPLHRLEGIFQRQGLHISRQTMDGWWLQTAEFLRPLYNAAVRVVLASHVIHTDDTSVKVTPPITNGTDRPRFSRIIAGTCRPTPSTATTGSTSSPKAGLSRWPAGLGHRREALVRRKFHESRRLDAARMETALAWIGKLYAVEKDLRERCQGEWNALALDQRAVRIAAERQGRSRPLLNSFHSWLEAETPKVLPKSPVRGAMDYTLSNWTALSVYLDDGWLDIDNNEGENSLRGLCIGRRNWLFCGSDRGGRAAAIHFSLLASCKRHGLDPWVYLRDVLTRLPAMLPGAGEEELLALLPHRWHPA